MDLGPGSQVGHDSIHAVLKVSSGAFAAQRAALHRVKTVTNHP
jgi:hypothetical protein